jgi:putative PIN family toxin of toxin-antitoxin system
VIRVVLDANVIVSGALGLDEDASPPVRILGAWQRGEIEVLVSDPLIAEVERTLAIPYFASRVGPDRAGWTAERLRRFGTYVEIAIYVAGIASHPEDDLILATAVSGRADYLVTGDAQLQKLAHYHSIPILSPRAFLPVLDQQEDREPPI